MMVFPIINGPNVPPYHLPAYAQIFGNRTGGKPFKRHKVVRGYPLGFMARPAAPL